MKLITIAGALVTTALVGCAATTEDVTIERMVETEGAEESQPPPSTEVVAAPVEIGAPTITSTIPRDSNDGAL